jgi:hypothetical protein
MKLLKSILFATTLLMLAVLPVRADETFSFKGGYFTLNPEGDLAVSGNGIIGDVLDIENDLGIDDDDGFFAEGALQLGAFRLFAGYLPVEFSGENILTRSIEFNGQTFVVGSLVESDVEIDIYEAGLDWFLVNLDDTPVRLQLGPEIAVKYIDVQAQLSAAEFGLQESESVGVAVPTLGVRARIGLSDFLGVVGRVGYLEYDGNSFLDADAQVEFSPLPLVGIFGGYRYLDVDVDEGDVYINATFSGPYAGALIRF